LECATVDGGCLACELLLALELISVDGTTQGKKKIEQETEAVFCFSTQVGN
jgi:hypothetical protein